VAGTLEVDPAKQQDVRFVVDHQHARHAVVSLSRLGRIPPVSFIIGMARTTLIPAG
jgi:hypothetical protein